MRSATLRWIMLTSTIIIAMIMILQLYWLKQVYAFEEQQFNSGVIKSIRGLFEDIQIADDPGFQLKQIVETADANTFIVKLDSIPPRDTLQYYLSNEFEDFDVLTDCNVGIYNVDKKRFLYQYYLSTAASRYPENSTINLPIIHRNYDYLMLNFPHRNKYIIHEMFFWITTSIFLLVVLIGISISLLYLYKQKFLNELQKDFVNNFTHEFKTPLAVMKIASEVLIQPSIIAQPERLVKYGTVIKEQTEHLQTQVERLLKFAASEHKKLIVTKEFCHINELIQKAIDQLEPLIHSNNATIQFNPDENDPVINIDKAHMQLVIINLIENAIKYSNNNPFILIEAAEGGGEDFAISIKDNGIGIEQKRFKHLFKKFYRVPTGNIHKVSGFGLGLNFVKKIIDAHHGKIIIKSVSGIGTEFKIFVPKK